MNYMRSPPPHADPMPDGPRLHSSSSGGQLRFGRTSPRPTAAVGHCRSGGPLHRACVHPQAPWCDPNCSLSFVCEYVLQASFHFFIVCCFALHDLPLYFVSLLCSASFYFVSLRFVLFCFSLLLVLLFFALLCFVSLYVAVFCCASLGLTMVCFVLLCLA